MVVSYLNLVCDCCKQYIDILLASLPLETKVVGMLFVVVFSGTKNLTSLDLNLRPIDGKSNVLLTELCRQITDVLTKLSERKN